MSIQPPSAAVSRGIPPVSPNPGPPKAAPRSPPGVEASARLGAVPFAGGPRGTVPNGLGVAEAASASVAILTAMASGPLSTPALEALQRAQHAYGVQSGMPSGSSASITPPRLDRRE